MTNSTASHPHIWLEDLDLRWDARAQNPCLRPPVCLPKIQYTTRSQRCLYSNLALRKTASIVSGGAEDQVSSLLVFELTPLLLPMEESPFANYAGVVAAPLIGRERTGKLRQLSGRELFQSADWIYADGLGLRLA